ncbi:MAG: hypothetical protein VR65_06830 [Desulfobulbaceae bacterium BRH_c16a]|nr:MAG: hypothetical protein VR65_06830 [Desulfobulbaceae bacterium BRH_c16a]
MAQPYWGLKTEPGAPADRVLGVVFRVRQNRHFQTPGRRIFPYHLFARLAIACSFAKRVRGNFKHPSSTAEFRIISDDVGEAWIDDIRIMEAG